MRVRVESGLGPGIRGELKDQHVHIRDRFPGISVSAYEVPWRDTEPPSNIPAEELERATVLVTGSVLPSREQAPNLGYVQLSSAGANHVLNHPLFTDTDIIFCTANGVHGGILGYGSIGRQTARVAKALGMDVHAYTLHPRDTPESRRDTSYHPPGLGDPDGSIPSKWFSGDSTADIHAFLGSDLDLLFAVLGKNKTFVSNIGRGPIIKTDDLIQALENDVISGAALDVTDPEPLPDGHPLWSTKNIIITPHVSGISTRYNERVLAILELNLDRLVNGEELANRVSRRDGY
ncbi:unnamed protein product [Parascedosporium putredinis]|uniref:D-isomer specific 2-hydroxyacid dehydrogenase NAD-binding domain-containing protein n=1 Tax=Parascedosporium putredinis TaxID=1442378 RepID=A0A9P1H5J1_9PEZI|nr:unnamed protein product [Parascedosporium putredinis]CAI7996548.1 unnamed protein product [Parascedosporium putredinis]